MIACMLSAHQIPMGANSFLLEQTPFQKGVKNTFDTVASLKGIFLLLTVILQLFSPWLIHIQASNQLVLSLFLLECVSESLLNQTTHFIALNKEFLLLFCCCCCCCFFFFFQPETIFLFYFSMKTDVVGTH